MDDEHDQDDDADASEQPDGGDAALMDDHCVANREILLGAEPAVGAALQDAVDHEEQPYGREDRTGHVETGPIGPQWRVDDAAGEERDRGYDQHLEQERRAPADVAGDKAANQGSGGRTKASGTADDAEVPGAGRDVVEQHGDQDVDGRDQQRRADAFEQGVTDQQQTEARGERRKQRTGPVYYEAGYEADLASPNVLQFAAGDHQCCHREREQRDGRLDAGHRRVEVGRDGADRHVHIRGGVAGDELGEGQRQHGSGRRRHGRTGRASFVHGSPSALRRARPAVPAGTDYRGRVGLLGDDTNGRLLHASGSALTYRTQGRQTRRRAPARYQWVWSNATAARWRRCPGGTPATTAGTAENRNALLRLRLHAAASLSAQGGWTARTAGSYGARGSAEGNHGREAT